MKHRELSRRYKGIKLHWSQPTAQRKRQMIPGWNCFLAKWQSIFMHSVTESKFSNGKILQYVRFTQQKQPRKERFTTIVLLNQINNTNLNKRKRKEKAKYTTKYSFWINLPISIESSVRIKPYKLNKVTFYFYILFPCIWTFWAFWHAFCSLYLT